MRELLAWPSGLLHPLPDSVTDTDGALPGWGFSPDEVADLRRAGAFG